MTNTVIRDACRRRLCVECLEDRLTPTTSLYVITQDPTPGQAGTVSTFNEFTPGGVLVRTIPVVPPPGSSAGEQAHDLVVTGDRAQVYNGTTDAVLSTYSVTTGSWSGRGLAGVNTLPGTIGSGGLAVLGTNAFQSDMPISGLDSTQGIVCFDLAAPAASGVRFAEDTAPIDLAAGLDGNLYSLDAGRVVRAYNPDPNAVGGPFPLLTTLTLPAQVNVPGVGLVDMDYRAIAVDQIGRIFAADWNGYVIRFDATGSPETAGRLPTAAGPVGPPVTNLVDLDVVSAPAPPSSGLLVAGSTNGVVAQLNSETLVATLSFAAGTGPAFVTAAPSVVEAAIGGPAAGVVEGNAGLTPVVFTVTLSRASADPVQVTWATAAGTAAAGTDFQSASDTLVFAPGETSKTITINVIGETTFEFDESFVVKLTAASNAVVAGASATATILNDDPLPTISVADLSVVEGTGGSFPNYRFNVTLSNRSYLPVTFSYAMADGTATGGVDYGSFGTGTLSIPAGSGGISFFGSIVPDTMYELDETFTLTISNPFGATLGQSVGTATILNDDLVPTIAVDSPSVGEGNFGSANLNFNVRLSNPSYLPVTVAYATADGTATGGSDYSSASGTLTFAPGTTVRPVAVAVSGDTLYELNETLSLTLSGPTNASLGPAFTGTGTILNDDALPTVSVNSPFIFEGNTGTTTAMTFTVRLSAPSGVPTTVTYATVDGTAVAGSDYTATSGTLTFAPGETAKSVTVSVLGDGLAEPTETLGLTAQTLGSSATGFGFIFDDDPLPTVLVNSPSVAEGDTLLTALNFTVSLSAPSGFTTTVTYATADGTAEAGSDYAATSGTLTFAPGETAKSVTVAVAGEGLAEPNETVLLTATTPGSSATGTGTILNDDSAPVANAGPDRTVDEGAAVVFDGSGSFDPDGDSLTYLWDFGDGATGAGVHPTHAFADNGTFSITLTVDDGFGNSSTDTAVVTVRNVAPTAGIFGLTSGVRGLPSTFSLTATDPSSVDQVAPFGYRINWGDGTTGTATGPATGTPATHTFLAAGDFTIRVWATDKDGSEGAAISRVFTARIAEVQDGNLVIGGTAGKDTIVITATSTPNTVAVKVNGVSLGTFTAPGQIVVYGQAGDDKVTFATVKVHGQTYDVDQELLLFGGDGNDVLDARTTTGAAVLVGGAGNDSLFAGDGRGILIGGAGADTMRGGDADDILISGLTIHDADPIGLAAIRTEWARTDAGYTTRRDHLLGSAGGLNGIYNLNPTATPPSVTEDGGASDLLIGNDGRDWFFVSTRDRLDDREGNETVTRL